MIKIKQLDVDPVRPYWNKNKMPKPVLGPHGEITEDPFPNIVMCAKKKSGKTTAAIYLIMKHFMTSKTKLNIFSGDITTDEDNKDAFKNFKEDHPEKINFYKNFIDKDGNDVLSSKISASDDEFGIENKFKFEYPRNIFYFDDLTAEELRSKQLDHLFKTNRHHGILDILCCHNMNHISPTCRGATNILIIFKALSNDQLDDIYRWASPNMDKQTFIRVYKTATATPKSFLFMNLDDKNDIRINLDKRIDIE